MQAMGLRSIFVFYITFILLGISTLNTNAQEAILSSGGDASGTGGTVSYSVGQVVYTTNTGSNGSASQGVQQPYEISVSTAIENATDILLEFKAYPNPVKDILKLTTGNRDFENIIFQLYGINGEIIKSGKVTGNETSIKMESLSPSVYFLKVIELKFRK